MEFQHIDMTQVDEIRPQVRMYFFYMMNIMVVDVLATQRAKASATMKLTIMNQIKSVPAR